MYKMAMNINNDSRATRLLRAILASTLVVALVASIVVGCSGDPVKEDSADSGDSRTQSAIIEPSDIQKYDEVREHLLNKEYPVAEAKLQAIVAKFPNHSGAWANLGLIYSETNRLEMAENALKKSIELDKKNTEVYLRLALVYKKQGKLVEALKAYKQSIEVDANNAKAHYNIAILYDLYLQDKPAAITHLEKYMDISGKQDDEIIAWIKQLERDEQRQQAAENSQ